MSRWTLACAAALLSLAAGAPVAAQSLQKVTAVIPQNSVFVLNWNGAKDAGVFKKHGIDLTIDVRPFGGYLSALASKQTPATTYSGLNAIGMMNEGLDLAVIGGGLTVVQDVFVLKNSPIKTVADLRGKRVGVWSSGAGAVKATRAAIMDAVGLDITKDAKIVQLAPPALFKLLQKGDIDAMVNISSFTVQAASQPDKYRSIFSANNYWKQKTGYPVVWAAPLLAWKSWINENPTRAKNYAAAVEESFQWLRQPANLEAAVKRYGKLASVNGPADVAVYQRWLTENYLFLSEWNQKVVDSQWQFLEMAKRHGVLPAVPDQKSHALILDAAS
jgi:NitT/TauT family transport system substrate-binding protein